MLRYLLLGTIAIGASSVDGATVKKVKKTSLVLELSREEIGKASPGAELSLSSATGETLALLKVQRIIRGKYLKAEVIDYFEKVRVGEEVFFYAHSGSESSYQTGLSFGPSRVSTDTISNSYSKIGFHLLYGAQINPIFKYHVGGYYSRLRYTESADTFSATATITTLGFRGELSTRLSSVDLFGRFDYSLYGNFTLETSASIPVADIKESADAYLLGFGLNIPFSSFAVGLFHAPFGQVDVTSEADLKETSLQFNWYF